MLIQGQKRKSSAIQHIYFMKNNRSVLKDMEKVQYE